MTRLHKCIAEETNSISVHRFIYRSRQIIDKTVGIFRDHFRVISKRSSQNRRIFGTRVPREERLLMRYTFTYPGPHPFRG